MSIPSINYVPEQYEQLLGEKAQRITQLLAAFNPPTPAIFPSPEKHFRMRAEFRIWHDRQGENNHCFYVMFEPDAPTVPVKVDHYPIGSLSITALMPKLLDKINQSNTLKHKLFQLEFLSTTGGEVLISLIYHRQLDEAWEVEARQLEQQFNIFVIGRARKQRLVISRDYVIETLPINSQVFSYHQQENSFTQPNAAINCKMIEWVLAHFSNHSEQDLLELYCGNGNFTIPLSRQFNQVLATEISKSSIRLAKQNCLLNDVDNIEFIRLSSDETASALKHEREFRRLKHIDIDSYHFSTVLVDPPRAGLDENTLELVANFDTIIYISCNPNTLAENLSTLSNTHSVKQFALFDQFPYTDHCECGVILQRLPLNKD
ncbi:MAG: tRNA (uridine(54)-C5)-methyltransferase TrmA [Cellvibrionales bacterium]|nr:tRNA (uridine(54)-C5)-methyltransferase TrmA [Cellvibrionales bacterium]MBT6579746.1 tRNA (uridine(54)-C5)-methyltransferase TrmA [Cellvibrionales bacterium]